MCIVFWKQFDETHPYRLILAFNRDEFFSRPTLGFHHWSTSPSIFAPQDLLPPTPQRGTYIGAQGNRLAFLTNFRETPSLNPSKISRGALVRDYLLSQESAQDYAQRVFGQRQNYDGFNLVLFDLNVVVYVTNRGYEEGTVKVLSGGDVMGLSNATIDDMWPKVEHGKKAFAQAIESSEDEQSLIANLIQMMSDPGPFSNCEPQCLDDLKQCIFVPSLDGIPGFLSGGQYGTRTTDILLLSTHQLTAVTRDHTKGTTETSNLKI
ncbi:hypothetical protein GGI13_000393 [Coemansia sp. RSA 455]|nr:hypothetical protein GGI13_000393 [Coemansia sp. RSA 455]KAJ2422513.1 hypothetical protein GGF41_003478 [Coemansia sp. RSA 2531]